MKIINNKIKLIIWDLDETFWSGTLSEGVIQPIDYNIKIIKTLTDRGIVNSISSKNNFIDCKTQLKKLAVWDLFVFPQISWNPKGQMIKDVINNMNLRPDNVLFIDDNTLNLNEALFFSPNLNVCLPEYIDTFLEQDYFKGKADLAHSRLNQYKNLEKKNIEYAESNMSNIDFLKESNISVEIKHDCLSELNRIKELIERTNQLNFTKNRISLDELKSLLKNPNAINGYINVKDRYGDYGISGFYSIIDNKLEHFLFSCRTMNMYIESWLYQHLNLPQIEINGDVAVKLNAKINLNFINNENANFTSQKENKPKILGNSKILMIGGCDLDQTAVYLDYKNLSTEFNYPNKININIHKDHTYLIKQFKNIQPEFIDLIDKLTILNVSDTELKINNEDWDILIFSPLNDYSRGIYKHRKNNFLLPFDSFNIDWTNEKNWDNLPKHLKTLPISFLNLLKTEFDFIGPISLEDFEVNIQWIIDTYKQKNIIFLNGSEIEFESENYWEKDMHKRHISMNKILSNISKKNSNVEIIDVTKFVNKKTDITDNIRHYNKKKYKLISDEIILITKDWIQEEIKPKNQIQIKLDKIKGKIINKIKTSYRN